MTDQSTPPAVPAPQDRAPVHPDQGLIDVIGRVSKLAGTSGRKDLAERLEHTGERLRDPHVRVIIVGEFKQGKSKLVNALINAPACPVDDDIATAVPTVVGYAPEPSASVLVKDADAAATLHREPIPLEELAEFVTGGGTHDPAHKVVGAEVMLPRELLRGGLRLVDSPGVGGLDSPAALSTLSALSSAHAVILVSDASQEYTEPEVQFLRHAMRVSPNVSAVLAKTDLYPDWRQIEGIDREHLAQIGEVPLFSVSSDLRLLAAQEHDQELNEESGFPALVAHLRRDILEHAELIHRRAAMHDLGSVVDQLSMTLQSELTVLTNPEQTPELIAKLEEAQARAEQFRSRASKWQVALNDGISDLISDLEHDLRDRLRTITREAEGSIEEADPGPIWDQISGWLEQRVAAAVSETFVWTDERARWLCENVADMFLDGQNRLPVIDVGDTDGVLDPIESVNTLDDGHMGATERIYIGVRGSYGGVLMVGLVTGLVGLPLINPFSLVAGILVGRRAYREDMRMRLARRQAEAKTIVRKYIDEVTFQVGKQLKDRLRMVQRVSRDHFGALAEELHRSFTEAVNAAKRSAAQLTTNNEERANRLRTQLQQLQQLRAQLAIEPATASAPQPPKAVAR